MFTKKNTKNTRSLFAVFALAMTVFLAGANIANAQAVRNRLHNFVDVTVNGTNFVNGATVQVNGQNRLTTFVSATQLTVMIPATDVAAAGTLNITVTNPDAAGFRHRLSVRRARSRRQ